MWLAGLPLWVTLAAKVGVVVWQPLQSPEVGWLASNAVGRESPALLALLASMPRKPALSWQVWHAATAAATVPWPATLSVGVLMLGVPSLKPPGLTFWVLWQPEPLQSRLPIGMWLPGTLTMVTLTNGPTVGPWQLRQPVTPWCVPLSE